MWEKNETVPRSGDYLPPMQIVSHIRINLPHIVIHLFPNAGGGFSFLVRKDNKEGSFFCVREGRGEKKAWGEGRLRLRRLRIWTADKLPSPRGEMGCWRRPKSCLFSVMQRLLSSYSPALASFMSSQTQGACFIPLWSFSLKFETFSLTSFCFSRGFCWFLGYWGGFVVES